VCGWGAEKAVELRGASAARHGFPGNRTSCRRGKSINTEVSVIDLQELYAMHVVYKYEPMTEYLEGGLCWTMISTIARTSLFIARGGGEVEVLYYCHQVVDLCNGLLQHLLRRRARGCALFYGIGFFFDRQALPPPAPDPNRRSKQFSRVERL